MATSESSHRENTYVLGGSSAEMVRLIEQDRLFTRAMNGHLSGQIDPSTLHTVLDLACGSGGWALELAQTYPHMHIIGVDINPGMIARANAEAQAGELDNVQFQVASALEPLEFAENSFDFVNARFIAGFLATTAWSGLLKEIFRITQHGGSMRLTDCEWGVTNSPAYHAIQHATIGAMQKRGQTFTPDGYHYSITPMLHHFLRDAGYEDIKEIPYIINFSAGMEMHQGVSQVTMVTFSLMQQFQISAGVVTKEEIERLHRQVEIELNSDDFRGLMYLLSAWGYKH